MKDVYEKKNGSALWQCFSPCNHLTKMVKLAAYCSRKGGVVTAYIQEWGFFAITGKAGGQGTIRKALRYTMPLKSIKRRRNERQPHFTRR